MFWANSKPKNFLNLLSGETKIYIKVKLSKKKLLCYSAFINDVGFN